MSVLISGVKRKGAKEKKDTEERKGWKKPSKKMQNENETYDSFLFSCVTMRDSWWLSEMVTNTMPLSDFVDR